MNTPTARSLTAKFYAYALFSELILIYPFYTLLFADKGLNPSQIATLLIIWSATAFALEVPSGAIADKFSRKGVLIVALLARALGFSAWLAFPSYWGFVAGFVCWGIGSALTSGTQEALLYDELAKIKQLPLYAKVTGRIESLNLAGVLLSGLVASALAKQGYPLLLCCSIAAVVLSAIPVALLPKSTPAESTGETKYISYLVQGVRGAFSKPAVLLIVLFASIMTGLGAGDEYYGLLFREKGFDNTAVAFWLAVEGLFAIAGSLIAHKLENKKLPLEAFMVVWAALMFGAAAFGGLLVPLCVGLFAMAYYIVKVLFTTYVQHAVSDKTRATTTSVVGLLSELVALALFTVIGLAAQHGSYRNGFYLLALIIIAAAAGLWLLARFISAKHDVEKVGL